jgi:hypothetical protein
MQPNDHSASRRGFLKKAVYAAPAVIALGSLTVPVSAHASIVSVNKNGPLGKLNTSGHYDNQVKVFTDLKTVDTRTGGKIVNIEYQEKLLSNNFFTNLWRSFFGV